MQKHLACSLTIALAAAILLTLSSPVAGQVSAEGSGVPMVSLDRLQAKSTLPAPRTVMAFKWPRNINTAAT